MTSTNNTNNNTTNTAVVTLPVTTPHQPQCQQKHQHALNAKPAVKIAQSVTSTASRSSKLKTFIWNKLASVRKHSTSSVNLSPSAGLGSVIVSESKLLSSATAYAGCNGNEKKQRRNIFHLFESSSKMKLNTGSSKKNATKSKIATNALDRKLNSSPEKSPTKTPTPDLIEDFQTTSNLPDKVVVVVPVVDLECNIKANLIDNSMVKSKIHAASRRNNARKQPTSAGSTSNVNSSFKNSFIELSSSSLNHHRMDIYGDDEQALSVFTHDSITDKMELSQTTTDKSSSDPQPIQFSTTTSNHSSSRSNHSSTKLMNTSHSIDSSSSLTTNLLEINEDGHQIDLFSGSGNLSHSKSLLQDSQFDDYDGNVVDHDESSKENLSNNQHLPAKKNNLTKLKSREFIRQEVESSNDFDDENKTKKKLLSKTIIYDNNFTNINDQKAKKNPPPPPPNSSHHSINSYYLQSNEFKSKSCERINGSSPSMQVPVKINDCNNNNTNNSTSRLAFIDDQLNSSDNTDNNFDCQNKKLNYSKSLKLMQQSSGKSAQNIDKEKSSVDGKGGGYGPNLNDRTNLNATVKASSGVVNNLTNNKFGVNIASVTNEPSWKELAFRKHTAWSQKNLEQKNAQNDKHDSGIDVITEKIEDVTSLTEGKVKSIISKFA